MKIIQIKNMVNVALAGEMLSIQELRPHLDFVIDEINTLLDSKFPVFSELPTTDEEYEYFPDTYIRKVVIPGAAWHFYVMDEEGATTAQQYQIDFEKGKFEMLRDYIDRVPVQYQSDNTGALPYVPDNLTVGDRGLMINGSNFNV